MSNSVGSVSIDLEANLAKFTSDLGRAQRILEQHASSMVRTASTVAGALGAGLSIAGITSWIKGAVDAQDAISKLSEKVAVSTETLSGWQLAAQQAGVGTDALQKGLVKLGQSAQLSVEGSKLQASAFKSIGVSVTDASGHLKNMQTLFGQVADKLAGYKDSTEKTVVATRLFGKAGADLIPLLNAGSKGLAEYVKMADDFGLTVGSKAAEAAKAFNDSLEQMGFVSKGVANQIATALAPAMAELAEKAVAFFRSDSWKETLETISTGAKAVADHIGDVVTALKTLMSNLDSVAVFFATRLVFSRIAAGFGALSIATDVLSASMVVLRGAIAAAGGWIGILVTGLAALSVGIYKYATRTSEAEQATDSYKRLLDQLHGASESHLEDSRKLAEGRADEAVKTIAAAQAELALMEARARGYEEAQKRLQSASTMTGGRVDSRMGASYASTAVDQEKKNIDAQIAFINAQKKGLADLKDFLSTSVRGGDKVDTAVAGLGKDFAIVNDNASNAAKALADFKKAQDALNAKAADAVAGYLGKNLAPDAQAWSDYAAVIRTVAEAEGERITKAQEAIAAGVKGVDLAAVEADAQKHVAEAIEQTNGKRQESIDLAQKQMSFGQTMADDAIRDANISAMSARDQQIARAGIEATNKALAQHRQLTDESVQAQIRLAEQGAATAYDLTKYAQEQQAIAQEYAGFWENAASSISKAFGDLITGQTKSWKDFGNSLKSIAQQFVSDMISTFLRMRVIGPIMAGVMGSAAGFLGMGGGGGGGSVLKIVSDYYGGNSSVGEAAGSVGGAGSGAYGGMLGNISAAKNLYTSMFGGNSYATAAQGLYTNPATGLTVNMPGFTPHPYGGYIGNTGLSYAGAAGGLAGAYWGLGRGSGGISTAASTATGAIGGYYAGTAIATTMTAGISAGLAAIPVVGWVALAAMAIDQVSGGKLFGTKYQTAASDATLSIGANGGSAAASLYQTKQGALFSGRKTRVVDQAVSPEMQAAANALYDGVEKTMVQGALKLGVDVPAMINASLQTHTTYNDKGQVRATEYIVNYLGQTWKEATAEAASQRIGAEALVATVAASAGAVAQTIAQQWRSSAETLLDGAQMMLAAQADIKRGTSLVALGASASLAQVVAFTQTMQAEGEKLADTYARLAQASAAYLQFVGQFAPVNNTFGGSLQAIAKQMQANIDQANALAQAAGLQGARESDLANIHQVAAQQAADAIAQLSSAAQDIAAKLYGVTNGSLSAVQAQLASMQSKVQQAAQLAIGDNSPLSTKEKLDVALQGLRSGITSADDVLSLGRKLYSSSADYTGLYNKVQDILGLGSATGTGAGSLSDQMGQYNSLFQQQQQLQAQADAMTRFTDAKTLAQYVADISTTHGIGYGEAASGLGFNLSDLAKDLGVSNLAGYLDNLKLADIPGVTLNASASVVDAIQQLGRDLIQTLTGGPITAAAMTGTTSVKATPNDPQVIALLDSINQRLTAIEGHSSTTADTNTQMVKQGVSNDLRTISGTTRSMA